MFAKWAIFLFADVTYARNILKDSTVRGAPKIWTINSQSGQDVGGNFPQAGRSADDEVRRIADNASRFNGARPKDPKIKKKNNHQNSTLAGGASTMTQGQTRRGHPRPQGESELDQVIRAELDLSSLDNTASRSRPSSPDQTVPLTLVYRPESLPFGVPGAIFPPMRTIQEYRESTGGEDMSLDLLGAHGGESPSAIASSWAADVRLAMHPAMRAALPFENPQIAPGVGDDQPQQETVDWALNLGEDDPFWSFVNDLDPTIDDERDPDHISLDSISFEEGTDWGEVTVEQVNAEEDLSLLLTVLTGDEEPYEACARLAQDFLPPEPPVVNESLPIFTPVRLHYTSTRPSMIACISSGRPTKTFTGDGDEWLSTRVVNTPVSDEIDVVPTMPLDEVAWHDMVPWGYTRETPRDWEPVNPGDSGLTGLVRFSNGQAGLRILDERMNPLIIIFSDPRHFDGNHEIVHRDGNGDLIFHVHPGMGIYYPGEGIPFIPSAMDQPHRNLANGDLIGEYHYVENRGFTGFWLRNSGYFRSAESSDIAWEWRISDGHPTPELESHKLLQAGVISDCPFCTAVDKALLNNEQHKPQDYVNKKSRLGAQRQQEAFEQWKRSSAPETRASGTKRGNCICILGDPAKKRAKKGPPP